MAGAHIASTDHTASPFQISDLSTHPEYARRVGEIVSLWAVIELRLSIIFGILLRAPPWQAWDAFFTLQNSRARIDMVRALAHSLDDRIPEKVELITLVERVQKAPAARNGYAHRPWIEYKGKLYQLDKPAVPIEESAKHHIGLQKMDNDLSDLRSLNSDLNEFQGRFGNRYPLPLEVRTDSPEPWPGKWPGRTRHLKSSDDPRTP
jgi:hypothetical protein